MITRDAVKKIANLSQLKVAEADLDKLAGELSQILKMADTLSAIDVSHIKPTAHAVEVQNVFRDSADQEIKSDAINTILQQTPKRDENFFLVPRVVEKSS